MNTTIDSLSWAGDVATITASGSEDSRTYDLHTTADLRGNYPSTKQISFSEHPGQMRVRSTSLMFDGLFALAMEEVRQNSVKSISDEAFNQGKPIGCPCFITGEEWPYVWTRDTAYAVDLALALVDPGRASDSLRFKLSERRRGGRLEIVQDTGSGGCWPVSTDRVVWAMGAWEVLKYLHDSDRDAFLQSAYEAIVNTAESDRRYVYDPRDGLYRGEQSFLDWREQSYASWTRENTVHIAMSKALSTNINHAVMLTVAADLAAESGEARQERRYRAWASDLKAAIQQIFWHNSRGLYSSLKNSDFDPAVLQKFDLLGESLAVIHGIAHSRKAAAVVANYPHTIAGAPVIWPQQPLTKIYHNRAIWPFVTAYALKAARLTENDAVVNHNMLCMMRGAALNLSNMENFEFLTLANWYEDGDHSGPEINSRRQLWSVAGYLSMVLDVVFGRQADQNGIRFKPFLTKQFRNECFASTDQISLYDIPYKGKRIGIDLQLPAPDGETQGFYKMGSMRLNGIDWDPEAYIGFDDLNDDNRLQIALTDASRSANRITLVDDDGDSRRFWAPREPNFDNIDEDQGLLRLHFNNNHETGNLFNVYRNGQQVAAGLSGTATAWVDPGSADHVNRVYCYGIESVFPDSDNASHHSQPLCHWPRGSITEFSVHDDDRFISLDGANVEFKHGRWHFNDWGYPQQTLEITQFTPPVAGRYVIQLVYGNAMGPLHSGITAAVKWVEVVDRGSGDVLDSGAVVMPHLRDWDTWGDSSALSVSLEAGRSCRLLIRDAYNMSYLQHFDTYHGQGGQSGPTNRANIAGAKILSFGVDLGPGRQNEGG